jgi:hypothetical protein
MGADYAWIGLVKRGDGIVLTQVSCLGSDQGGAEKEWASVPVREKTIWLRARVTTGAAVKFSYSVDGSKFVDAGEPFVAKPGRWIGAKIGLFALTPRPVIELGNADFDDFRIE